MGEQALTSLIKLKKKKKIGKYGIDKLFLPTT